MPAQIEGSDNFSGVYFAEIVLGLEPQVRAYPQQNITLKDFSLLEY